MTQTRLPKRHEIDQNLTFDLEALYSSVNDWTAVFESLEQDLPALTAFQGQLGESGCALLEFLTLNADYEIKLCS